METTTTTGSTVCEGMYSKLIDDEAAYFDELNSNRDVVGYRGKDCCYCSRFPSSGSGPVCGLADTFLWVP